MATYLRPGQLGEALAAISDAASRSPADPVHRMKVLAGGTDVFPAKTTRQAWFLSTPDLVLDISGIDELKGISVVDRHVRIGALTTWTDIATADLPSAFDGLKQAARQVGGIQIQNRGTIAGNICNASPAADGVPPLLALDAEVELSSSVGTRILPLASFLLGNRSTALRPDELVTAILVPTPVDHEQGTFRKLGARAYLVISIASVATCLTLDSQNHIVRARIAVGACSATPQRLGSLEADLVGLAPAEGALLVEDRHLGSLSPIDDVRASAAYRRAAALTLVRRVLGEWRIPRKQAA